MSKQILSEEFRKMQKLAGIKLNENSSNSMINEEDDYTFLDFESSPDKYPYNDVLNMIKSLNDKDILDDFELTFKIGNEPVYKDAYEEFINDRTWWDDEIKKSYLSKWIELGKKLNENDDEIDYDDENFSDSFIDDEGFDDDFDLNREFKKSQSKHSYDEVLEIIKSYEDENMLNDFKSEFPKNEFISRDDYSDFTINYIDDMSEVPFIQANWISITDPDIYDKAGLV